MIELTAKKATSRSLVVDTDTTTESAEAQGLATGGVMLIRIEPLVGMLSVPRELPP